MKKVLALVLAVMMVSTVAFAAGKTEGIDKVSSVNPGGSIDVDVKGVGDGVEKVYAEGTNAGLVGTIKLSEEYIVLTSKEIMDNALSDKRSQAVKDKVSGLDKDSGIVSIDAQTNSELFENLKTSKDVTDALKNISESDQKKLVGSYFTNNAGATGAVIAGISDVIFRDVTNENYSVSSVRVNQGKNYVTGVKIYDGDQAAKVEFLDDLRLTNPIEFDVSYTLRGKGKMKIKDTEEQARYILYTGRIAAVDERVTIPSVKFSMHGKLGYGKVTVSIGEEGDQDLDRLPEGIEKDKDVVEFKRSADPIGTFDRTSRAGSYVADAILTEDYDEGLTLEARVYSGDKLFFNVDYKPDRAIVGSLADHDGDLDFYAFTKQKDFVTFNSNVKLIFNDAEETDQVYKVVDQKLLPIGSYDEDEGCWVVKERILGTYVISDINLDNYIIESGEIANPDTGANDVVGIATALAAVALVSAAAISLKK